MKHPSIFLLDETYQVIATFSNELPKALPVISDVYERSLDDNSYIVTMSTSMLHPMSKEIKVGRYVFYPTINEGNKHLFKIVEIQEDRGETNIITFKAELTVMSELLEQIVRPTDFKSASPQEILDYILKDTQWKGRVESPHPNLDYVINDYKTSLESLNELLEILGMIVEYKYVYGTGMDIREKVVILNKDTSDDIVAYVSRERDLHNIMRTIDDSDVVTTMIAIGGEGTNGEKITLAGLSEGTIIPQGFAHSFGSDMLDNTKALEGKPRRRYGIFNYPESKSPIDLLEKTIEKMKELSTPKVKYEVNFSLINKTDNIALGSHIYINDTTISPPLALSAKVRQMSTSIYAPSTNVVVLGNYRTYNTDINRDIKDLQDRLDREEEELNINSLKLNIHSSNGFNFHNYIGETTLTMMVYRNGLELDSDGKYYEYIWRRYNSNGVSIPISGAEMGEKEIHQKSLKIVGSYFDKTTNKVLLTGSVRMKENNK